MKKILLITLGSIAIIGSAAFYTFEEMTKKTVSIKETKNEVTSVDEKMIEIQEQRKEPIEEEFPNNMSELAVQNAIHSMSHQKIKAKEKWGFTPLTEERVKRLLTVLKQNKAEYKYVELYKSILNRWLNHDFSQVDIDHNAIWELQDGNIGRATGILSTDEEREFIEEHFNIE